jgi:hypothetical protein
LCTRALRRSIRGCAPRPVPSSLVQIIRSSAGLLALYWGLQVPVTSIDARLPGLPLPASNNAAGPPDCAAGASASARSLESADGDADDGDGGDKGTRLGIHDDGHAALRVADNARTTLHAAGADAAAGPHHHGTSEGAAEQRAAQRSHVATGAVAGKAKAVPREHEAGCQSATDVASGDTAQGAPPQPRPDSPGASLAVQQRCCLLGQGNVAGCCSELRTVCCGVKGGFGDHGHAASVWHGHGSNPGSSLASAGGKGVQRRSGSYSGQDNPIAGAGDHQHDHSQSEADNADVDKTGRSEQVAGDGGAFGSVPGAHTNRNRSAARRRQRRRADQRLAAAELHCDAPRGAQMPAPATPRPPVGPHPPVCVPPLAPTPPPCYAQPRAYVRDGFGMAGMSPMRAAPHSGAFAPPMSRRPPGAALPLPPGRLRMPLGAVPSSPPGLLPPPPPPLPRPNGRAPAGLLAKPPGLADLPAHSVVSAAWPAVPASSLQHARLHEGGEHAVLAGSRVPIPSQPPQVLRGTMFSANAPAFVPRSRAHAPDQRQ